MTLRINKRITKRVAVEVLNLKWFGVLSKGSVATGVKCSACKEALGERRWATAWIKDGSAERSMRLCEKCAMDAETKSP